MTKICRDCRHYQESDDGIFCTYGNEVVTDPVTGLRGRRGYRLAVEERQTTGVCGPEGKRYEARPWWARALGLRRITSF